MPRMREVALEQKVLKLAALCDEQADRISALEKIARQLYECATTSCDDCLQEVEGHICQGPSYFAGALRELGIEVDE